MINCDKKEKSVVLRILDDVSQQCERERNHEREQNSLNNQVNTPTPNTPSPESGRDLQRAISANNANNEVLDQNSYDDTQGDSDPVRTKSSSRNQKHESQKQVKRLSSFDKAKECAKHKHEGTREESVDVQHGAARSPVSMGRGAKLTVKLTVKPTLLKLLLILSMVIQTSMAAENGRFSPTPPSYVTVVVFLVTLCVCAWCVTRKVLQQVHMECTSDGTSESMFHQPKQGPREPSGSRFVYTVPNGQPTLHLLPGCQTVRTHTTTTTTTTAAAAVAAAAATTFDLTSNSYAANFGFEPPEHPLYPHAPPPRLVSSLCPYVPAVMAVGDPIPMTRIRNSQTILNSSEMVTGLRPSPYLVNEDWQPYGGSVKDRDGGRCGYSRSVSFPSEDSNVCSFNADTVESELDNGVSFDGSVLSVGRWRGRSQQANYELIGSEKQEELAYPPFVDPGSAGLQLDDNPDH